MRFERKKRVITPDLRKKMRLKGKLKELGIRLVDLARKTKKNPSLFSKALSGDSVSEPVLKIVEREIKRKERKLARARKHVEFI